jgi:hypothetical protein
LNSGRTIAIEDQSTEVQTVNQHSVMGEASEGIEKPRAAKWSPQVPPSGQSSGHFVPFGPTIVDGLGRSLATASEPIPGLSSEEIRPFTNSRLLFLADQIWPFVDCMIIVPQCEKAVRLAKLEVSSIW